jgi:hypothetical protein
MTRAQAICLAMALFFSSAVSAQTEQGSGLVVEGRGTESTSYASFLNFIAPRDDLISLTRSDGESSSSTSLQMSTGQLRVSAQSALGSSQIFANARANLFETITVNGPISAPVVGLLSFTVDGSILQGDPPPAGAGGNGGVSSAALTAAVLGGQSSSAEQFFVSDTCSTFSGTPCLVGSSFSQTLTAPFTITNSSRQVTIQASLQARAFNGTLVDFSNTGTLGLSLPAGLTFTSGTGLFLTSPVPEPSTTLLLALGLTVLVFSASGRRRGERPRKTR